MKPETFDHDNRLLTRLDSNPLLDALGEKIPYSEIAERIAYFPLDDMDVNSAPDREDLLAFRKKQFIPTSSAISIVDAMQTQLREHYILRAPSNVDVLRKLYQLASFKGKSIDEVPWMPQYASGIIIKGITGTGKTAVWERYFSLLPQTRTYENGEVPGFAVMKQIIWLKVDMSADGSRGGLLLSILSAVDERIGTDYFAQYSKRNWTVEKLMVVVGIVLSVHFCGTLIIEEIQAENFNDSRWWSDIATFFLRLLNFGIPVILVGNPLGFGEQKKHTQTMRRLSSGGSYWLHPADCMDDLDWKEALVPNMWNFDVMPVRSELTPEIENALYRYTGGFPDFLVRLIIDAQRISLRRGKPSLELTDLEDAYEGPTFIENHALIRAFADKNPDLLAGMRDVPTEYYKKRWKELSPHGRKLQAESPSKTDESSDDNARANRYAIKEAHYKRNATASANRKNKVDRLNATLPREDMRREGGRNSLLSTMEEFKKRISE